MKANDQRLAAYRRTSSGESSPNGGVEPAAGEEGLLKIPFGSSREGSDRRQGSDDRQGSDNRDQSRAGTGPGSGPAESPYRKAAKFLVLIGKEEAARILSRLTETQAERIAAEIASLRHVTPDEASVVFAEFQSLFKKAREPSGGLDTAREILSQAFGDERAEEMLRKSVPNLEGKPFDYLAGLSAERIDRLLAGELPAVKALVLSQLESVQAAGVIKLMAMDEKKDIVLRLARLSSIQPEIIRRVDGSMREKVLNAGTGDESSVDGRSALANILRSMDPRSGGIILEGLSGNDPELGRDLKTRLFTEDDVARADDRFMQERLRIMEDREIALIVRGRNEGFRSKVFANVSKTRGARILEEESLAEGMSRQECDRSYSAFLSSLRAAWERGELVLTDREDREEWVR